MFFFDNGLRGVPAHEKKQKYAQSVEEMLRLDEAYNKRDSTNFAVILANHKEFINKLNLYCADAKSRGTAMDVPDHIIDFVTKRNILVPFNVNLSPQRPQKSDRWTDGSGNERKPFKPFSDQKTFFRTIRKGVRIINSKEPPIVIRFVDTSDIKEKEFAMKQCSKREGVDTRIEKRAIQFAEF
jgi:hypothetical protein